MRFQSLERLFERSASNSAIVCPSTSAAPWLAFTFLKASQTSRFGMSNGFALATELLPLPVGSGSQLNNALGHLPLHRGDRFSRSIQQPDPAFAPPTCRMSLGQSSGQPPN